MLICHVSIVATNGQTKRQIWRRPFVFLAATIRDFEQAVVGWLQSATSALEAFKSYTSDL